MVWWRRRWGEGRLGAGRAKRGWAAAPAPAPEHRVEFAQEAGGGRRGTSS